ncbi:Cytochrome P450 CYP4, partial [Frankliniella occidentalis]
MVVES